MPRHETKLQRVLKVLSVLGICTIISFQLFDRLWMWLFFPLLYIVVRYLLEKACHYLVLREHLEKFLFSEEKKGIFLRLFAIIFFGQLLFWFAYYPGGFNLDAYGQWDQIHGVQALNNWHPVLTTGIYWLLTRIVDNLAFVIFVQICIYSVVAAILLNELCLLGIKRIFVFIVAIVTAINPAICTNNICLIKDVIFTIAITLLTWTLLRIYSTKGGFIKNAKGATFLIIQLITISLIRHNALFFALPVMILLFLLYRQYRVQLCVIVSVAIFGIIMIQGPIYSLMKVERHSNIVGEVVGVPMASMANTLVANSEHIPQDVKDYLLDIADMNDWKEYYVVGEWDSCKWKFGGTDLLKNESLPTIMEYATKTFVSSPETVYQSVRNNMRVVWQIAGPVYWDTDVYIEENGYGIESISYPIFKDIADIIVDVSLSPIGATIFWNLGWMLLVLLLLLYYIAVSDEMEKLLFIIPTLIYVLLTACLLAGPNYRYFYFIDVILVPSIMIVTDLKSKSEGIS